jgi:ABC-type Fe3+-hydroxamate transport system substrate-binding protein
MMMANDQLGRIVHCPERPQRIISLVPSQTELLYALGLDDQVCGITRFCIHPAEWFNKKKKVGGTKSLHFEIIDDISPDLIIANKEENRKEDIDMLANQYNVWVSDVSTLNGAYEMMRGIGLITGKMQESINMIRDISKGFAYLEKSEIVKKISTKKISTAYLVWRNPFMAAGNDCFIHAMLNICGLNNYFENKSRYPETSLEELRSNKCELLLLSSEPFPFRESHIAPIAEKLPDTQILLADGEMFSWYGSRMGLAPAYFTTLLERIRQ